MDLHNLLLSSKLSGGNSGGSGGGAGGGSHDAQLPFDEGYGKFASGSFVLDKKAHNFTIEHNLGHIPNGVLCIPEGNFLNFCDSKSRYLCVLFQNTGTSGSRVYRSYNGSMQYESVSANIKTTIEGSRFDAYAYGATEKVITIGVSGASSSGEQYSYYWCNGVKYYWFVW